MFLILKIKSVFDSFDHVCYLKEPFSDQFLKEPFFVQWKDLMDVLLRTMHVNSANTMTIALMFSLNNTHFCTDVYTNTEVYYQWFGETPDVSLRHSMVFRRPTYISLFQRGLIQLKCETCDPFAVWHSFRSIWWTWLQHLCVWHNTSASNWDVCKKTNNQCKHAIVNLHENSRCWAYLESESDELDGGKGFCFTSKRVCIWI